MAISRDKKQAQLQALVAKFKDATGVAFVKFDKATVNEVQTVRRELRAQGMSYDVIKRTLISIAAKETGLAEFGADDMEGMVAVICSPDDIVLPAQMIKKFKKDFFDKKADHAKFDFAGAVFEGNFLDASAAESFANTPTKEESLGRIVGMLMVGPQKLHTVFKHGLQSAHAIMKDADKFAKTS